MMHTFYFILKALLFLRYLNFCFDFFGHMVERLDKKFKVNLKIYDVTTWLQTITIHILFNISRSEGNQAMKSGQLIEYNTRNIFLEKPYIKCGAKTSRRPFLRNQN